MLSKEQLRDRLKSQAWLPEVTADSLGDQPVETIYWLVEWLENKDKKLSANAAAALIHIVKQSPPLSEKIFDELKSRFWDKAAKLSNAASHRSNQSSRQNGFLHSIAILREMKDERATGELIRLLKCKNDEVAASAVNALAALKAPQGTEPLIHTLLERTAQDRKWRYLRPALIGGIIALIVGFIWLTGFKNIGGMAWGIGQGMVALWALNRWTSFLKNSVEALQVMQDPKAIGALALCARDQRLRQDAIKALQPLMDQLNQEKFVALTPEQMEALTELLDHEDAAFQSALIRGLSVIGDEQAVEALEAFTQNARHAEALRNQAAAVLPALRDQVARRAEARTLMRAPSEEAEAETLMRAPDPQPDIPNEQLLRAEN